MNSDAEAQAAQSRFDTLAAAFAGRTGVELPDTTRRGFGSDALRVHRSIFAMITGGRFVVKLPAHRVQELLDSGDCGPFDAGKGKPMKEWAVVRGRDEDTWRELAEEALAFVGRKRTG